MTIPTEFIVESQHKGGTIYKRMTSAEQLSSIQGNMTDLWRKINGKWTHNTGRPVPEEFLDD